MASGSDSLSIDSIRLQRDYPLAQTQAATARPIVPGNHPAAAAAARARIASLPDISTLSNISEAPATPTADLVTDRAVLAVEAGDPVARRPLPSIVQPFLTAAGIFLLTLLVFKSPIIISQVGYIFHKQPAQQTAISANAAAASVPAANTISIPKINVNAPVVYLQSTNETDIETALESGVVHYGNTALPGQDGNVAIFGHSSNDWWEPGNFKFVFVLLDKLAPGDEVTIDYNSKAYVYQVTSSKIVDPTDVAVLDPTTTPTLTLITCSPPGTSLRRLVVTAKQISPNPATATTSTASTSQASGGSLPSAPSSFLTEIEQAWNGITSGIGSLFGAPSSGPSSSPQASPGGVPASLPAAN